MRYIILISQSQNIHDNRETQSISCIKHFLSSDFVVNFHFDVRLFSYQNPNGSSYSLIHKIDFLILLLIDSPLNEWFSICWIFVILTLIKISKIIASTNVCFWHNILHSHPKYKMIYFGLRKRENAKWKCEMRFVCGRSPFEMKWSNQTSFS